MLPQQEQQQLSDACRSPGIQSNMQVVTLLQVALCVLPGGYADLVFIRISSSRAMRCQLPYLYHDAKQLAGCSSVAFSLRFAVICADLSAIRSSRL